MHIFSPFKRTIVHYFQKTFKFLPITINIVFSKSQSQLSQLSPSIITFV